MSLKKFILSFLSFFLLWSCSSNVKFTSKDIDEIKTFGSMVYSGSKKIIERLEQDYKNEGNHDEFEGKILQYSKEWLGTPYKYGGTSKSGVDCSGFVLNVYKKVGIEIPRTSRQQHEFTKRIQRDNLIVGDLVFFRRGNRIGHVGIYLGRDKVVHASTSKGVIIQDINNDYLRRTYAASGRIR